MKRISILLSVTLCLFGCAKTQTAVRVESQQQSTTDILAARPDIAPNTILISTRKTGDKILEIDFMAHEIDIEPVFGTSINLRYDSEVLTYSSYTKGDFLEQGGEPTGNQKPTYMINAAGEKEKRLVIGATLFRGTPGVTGTGKLLTLRFQINKDTPTEIAITKAKLKNLQAKDITKIQWPTSIPIRF